MGLPVHQRWQGVWGWGACAGFECPPIHTGHVHGRNQALTLRGGSHCLPPPRQQAGAQQAQAPRTGPGRSVPPAPSMEVTDFQGSGRVPYLLRGADSEEDIPAGERSASPQHGGCFLRGRGFQVGLEGCMAPAPLCTECHCSHHRGQLPADSRPRAVPLSPPQRGVGWHLAETHSMPASCAGCLSTHQRWRV